jgi:hypothetical protein
VESNVTRDGQSVKSKRKQVPDEHVNGRVSSGPYGYADIYDGCSDGLPREKQTPPKPREPCKKHIPDELKAQDRWGIWFPPSKQPRNARTQGPASPTDPSTWSSFQVATRYPSYLCHALGDGLAGIDLDDCLDRHGKPNKLARAILDRFPTYTELSPSERGLHLFLKGRLPDHVKSGRKKDGVEVYHDRKFFTVTGWHLKGTPFEVTDCSAELLRWFAETFGPTKKNSTRRIGLDFNRTASLNGELDQIVQTNDTARSIWDGGARYPSASESDLAFANVLFSRGLTPQQVYEGLVAKREHLGEPVKSHQYFEKTIAKAGDQQPAKVSQCHAVTSVTEPEISNLEDLELRSLEGFPIDVYPQSVQKYFQACAESICCPVDFLAVPLLSVAGVAIGRSKRRLKVKPGYVASSCVWALVLCPSGTGKSPALEKVLSFYYLKAKQEYLHWKDAGATGDAPTLILTDTTMESLKNDLPNNEVLFPQDEMSSWASSMSQYRKDNSDRPNWNSFWSHSPIYLGRKGTGKVYIPYPFVSPTGMMVPESLTHLNDRGNPLDGLVFRFLIVEPEVMIPVDTEKGVSQDLTDAYHRAMGGLFAAPEAELTFAPGAREHLRKWLNEVHFQELTKDSPGTVISWYSKLKEYAYRLCLVLHEVWRAARCVNNDVVDLATVKRVIKLLGYFKSHLPRVQKRLGVSIYTRSDKQYHRLKRLGVTELTVEQATHRGVGGRNARKEIILDVFKEWESRDYGLMDLGASPPKFVFKQEKAT